MDGTLLVFLFPLSGLGAGGVGTDLPPVLLAVIGKALLLFWLADRWSRWLRGGRLTLARISLGPGRRWTGK